MFAARSQDRNHADTRLKLGHVRSQTNDAPRVRGGRLLCPPAQCSGHARHEGARQNRPPRARAIQTFAERIAEQMLRANLKPYYNRVRPHSALGYRPPAPETITGVLTTKSEFKETQKVAQSDIKTGPEKTGRSMSQVGSMKRTRLVVTVLAIASLMGAGAARAQMIFVTLLPSPKQISSESIQALEQRVIMPADTAPVTSYDRYYAPGIFEGRDVIVGVFLKRPARLRDGTQVPGFLSAYATTVEKLPRIPAGGCTVITVYFDLTSASFIKLPMKGKDPQLAVCNSLA